MAESVVAGIVNCTDYGMNGQTLRTINAFSTGAPIALYPDQDQSPDKGGPDKGSETEKSY